MATNWKPELIDKMAQQLEESQLHSREQAASWQRWVMAACLSMNGGAAIALLNLDKVHAASQFWSIVWFVVGLTAAIFFGIVCSILMDEFDGYYRGQAFTLRRRLAGDLEPRLDMDTFDRLAQKEIIIHWFQFTSLICFIIGIAVAVEGLKSPAPQTAAAVKSMPCANKVVEHHDQ
jgi:hypothetical protein